MATTADQTLVQSNTDIAEFTHNGYLYIFARWSSDGITKFWRCEEACRARIHTVDGKIVKFVNRHNHSNYAIANKVTPQTKRKSEESDEMENARKRICSSPENYSPILNKNRIPAATLPVHENLEQVVILPSYQQYEVRPGITEKFLLADSGPGAQRILIFGRHCRLKLLMKSRTWFTDEISCNMPGVIKQIFTISVERFGDLHPVLYALLPNNEQSTYKQLFRMIDDIQPDLGPESISCDFELNIFQAVQEVHPRTKIFGCFFRLYQKLLQLNVHEVYYDTADFALQVKMIASLAFVPFRGLDDAIDDLSAALPPELRPLLSWFETNFAGRMTNRGMRLPLFPFESWNVYDHVLTERRKTDILGEEAYRRLNLELGLNHPTIWKLIDELRKVEKVRDVYYEKLVAGYEPVQRLEKYREADQRIVTVANDYSKRDILEYLRGISYNFDSES